MNKLSLSIIIPVYNAEKNISNCLDSILKRKTDNFEIILIDDGSNDGSLSICKYFAEKDTRVKVIHQNNAGPSAARNAGLRIAKGEWISFVDADDILLDCFFDVLTICEEKNADLAYAGYAVIEKGKKTIATYESKYYIAEQIPKLLSKTDILHRCSPWGKFFKRKIIIDNNIYFDEELRHSEDRLFLYNYLLYVKTILTSSIIVYLYFSISNDTAKNKILPFEMLLERQLKLQNAGQRLIERYKFKGKEILPILRHLIPLFYRSLQGCFFCSGAKKVLLERQKELWNVFCKNDFYYSLLKNEELKYIFNKNIEWTDAVNGNFEKINFDLFILSLKEKIRSLLIRKKSKSENTDNVLILNLTRDNSI